MKSAYSNEPIDLNLLLTDDKAYEIDHILPISLSFDDSYDNKVLVTHSENQDKGQRTPFEYFSSGKGKITYSEFTSIIKNNKKISKKKISKLLYEEDLLNNESQNKFIARNLQDTRFATRKILNLLQEYYKCNDIDTKIFAIRGLITNQFRKKAHIKKERDIYKHHAMDALILAEIRADNRLIGCLDRVSKKELKNKNLELIDNKVVNTSTGEVIEDTLFTDKMLNRIELIRKYDRADGVINFSWKVDKKTNRSIADQTIFSTRIIGNKHILIRKYKDIYGKDGEKIKKLFLDKEEGKLLVSKHDIKTFQLIKKVIECYPNEKNPFQKYMEEHGKLRKYSKKGNGPIIDNLKYEDKELGNHIDITKKYETTNKKVVLLQISPYRMDLYLDNGIYKFVTIRYPHIKKNNDINYIDKQLYSNLLKGKNISSNAKFLFSLYRNECLFIKTGKYEGYYRFIGVKEDKSNTIEVKSLDVRDTERKTPQITKNTISIQKYHTNILGEKFEAKNETLQLQWK